MEENEKQSNNNASQPEQQNTIQKTAEIPAENTAENKAENTAENTAETTEKLENCDYCQKPNSNIDYFIKCKSKICPQCLFRRIFLKNITDLSGKTNEIKILCSKCKDNECYISKTLDDLFEVNNKRKLDNTENSENQFIDNTNNCPIHHGFKDQFCMNCLTSFCKSCDKDIHDKHNVLPNGKVVNLLKAELANMPIKLGNKEIFLENWENICNKLKETTQEIFSETMTKIDELSQKILDFKKEFELNYKNQLTNLVKTVKLLKIFYLDFYSEKSEAKESRDINLLSYVNSIENELDNINITKDINFIQKIDEIKQKISDLESKNKVNFESELVFSKLPNNYKCENVIPKAHTSFISSILETKDLKLISAGIDYSIKVWEEKDNELILKNELKPKTGPVTSAILNKDNQLLTSTNNKNDIFIWDSNNKEGYSAKQSFVNHTKYVSSMCILENDMLVSGGLDQNIIIYENKNNGYEKIQQIPVGGNIAKIINLKNNRFGYYFYDDISVKIMKMDDDKKFSQCCILEKDKNKKGKITCICELDNGYILNGYYFYGEKEGEKSIGILVWKKEDENSYKLIHNLKGHTTDINDIIQLKDGRFASSSKDRSIRIWKLEKNKKNELKYVTEEKLTEYAHGMYLLIQLKDGRICSTSSDNSIIIWRNRGNVPYC